MNERLYNVIANRLLQSCKTEQTAWRHYSTYSPQILHRACQRCELPKSPGDLFFIFLVLEKSSKKCQLSMQNSNFNFTNRLERLVL